jgi:hypothetical protein
LQWEGDEKLDFYIERNFNLKSRKIKWRQLMLSDKFSNEDIWKGIILFGLNAATYKMALAKCLFFFAQKNQSTISWDEIATCFLQQYLERLKTNPMPQQGNPAHLTVMERIVKKLEVGLISHSEAVDSVADKGLEHVVPRFQTIGRDNSLIKEHFYSYNYGKDLTLKDSLLGFSKQQLQELEEEFIARWSLLEGAFTINHKNFALANDIREIYLKDGYDRTPLTSNIPFLKGYQGNICFYCCETLGRDIHVDHVLPRQVLCHDEIWNLVLSHGHCNLLKLDKLVGPHFVNKLIARNENIMGSNHPWKYKISAALGNTPAKRASSLKGHYENVKKVLGRYYWGGFKSYNPGSDPFYRRLITVLNNGGNFS